MDTAEFLKIQEAFNIAVTDIKKCYDELKRPCICHEYSSDDMNELGAAMALAQQEFGEVLFKRKNPFAQTKYPDLHSLMQAVQPSLSKNGIFLTQQTKLNEQGITTLHTKIIHSSGQWFESRVRIVPPKDDIQKFASLLNFQRRLEIMNVLGLTLPDDRFDDDGEKAVAEYRDTLIKGTDNAVKYDPSHESYEKISKDQYDMLTKVLNRYPDISEMLLNAHKIQAVSDLPRSKFDFCIEQAREMVLVRDENRKRRQE